MKTKALPKAAQFSLDFLPTSMGREYLIAGFLTVLWLSALLTYGAGYFGVFAGIEGQQEAKFLDVILYVSALVIPIMFVWLGAYMVCQMRQMNEDARRLKATIEKLGNAVTMNSPASNDDLIKAISETMASSMHAEQSRMTTHFRNLSDQQTKIEAAVRTLLKSRGQEHQAISQLVETAQDVAQKAARTASVVEKRGTKLSKMTFDAIHSAVDQDSLPLDSMPKGSSSVELEWDDLVRALNFPEDETDQEGFSAIRKVLPNRVTAQLLQASEDLLSMLAQEGIYMDDLGADEANPDLWRKFAQGTRGAEIAEMGTIIDQAALALARGRTRSDTVFRDGSMHFMRLFDRFVQEFIDQATDRDIEALAQTRTGRAFQLMARASGTFD